MLGEAANGARVAKTEVQQAMDAVQSASQLFLDRLDAELPHNDPRMTLRIFDLEAWQAAQPNMRDLFQKFVRQWLHDLGCDREAQAVGALQYRDAVSLSFHGLPRKHWHSSYSHKRCYFHLNATPCAQENAV